LADNRKRDKCRWVAVVKRKKRNAHGKDHLFICDYYNEIALALENEGFQVKCYRERDTERREWGNIVILIRDIEIPDVIAKEDKCCTIL
jgi:hypothetical protein